MNLARWSWRALRREWRSGELRGLALAVVVAVAAITSVGFFTDRVQRAMTQQAASFIAADLRVRTSEPSAPEWQIEARERGLRTARLLTFPSVVRVGERSRLVGVKAVSPAYPLRGQLEIAPQPEAAGSPTRQTPARGTVWLAPRLLRELDLAPGDTVELGASTFTVGPALTLEPDGGGTLFEVAPRLLMRLEDVPATELVQPGSRVRHHLLVAGPPGAVKGFRRWLSPRLQAGQRMYGVEDARPRLRAALDRGRRFLGLAALVAVVVAGVAIAIGARRYAQRRLDTTAVLRCLGASQGLVTRLFTAQLLWLGLAAGAAGSALGFATQWLLGNALQGLLPGSLPAPGAWPAAAGVLAGLIALGGFALPPMLRLRRVSPLRVLRRDLAPVPPGILSVYGAALTAVGALTLWQAADLRLALYFLAGTLMTLLALGTGAWALIHLAGRLRHRLSGSWRFGLTNVARRPGASTAQVAAFGLGAMALLLLAVVRTDLLDDWRRTLPADAPNQFAINIQTDQVSRLRAFFRARDREPPLLHPMVRGRLLAIDGEPVDPERYENRRARHLATRAFNLTWLEQPQPGNRVSAGRWWSSADHGRPLWSVEEGIARELGIEPGDTLTFRIAGRELTATVASLRKVQWESFQPNFFVAAPPGLLDDYPLTWICSFRLPEADTQFTPDLLERFPNITLIDVAALMGQVRSIMDRVAQAVEYVFAFTLLAGLVVLYTAIQATREERFHEGALVRALGGSRRQLLVAALVEFVVVGLLAGILAALGATAGAYVIATQLLELTVRVRAEWWLLGVLLTTAGVAAVGVLGTRAMLREPPMRVLQRV